MSTWRVFTRVTVTGDLRGAYKGPQEQPQGLKFQTPGVVLFGLHLARSARIEKPRQFNDRHGIRQER